MEFARQHGANFIFAVLLDRQFFVRKYLTWQSLLAAASPAGAASAATSRHMSLREKVMIFLRSNKLSSLRRPGKSIFPQEEIYKYSFMLPGRRTPAPAGTSRQDGGARSISDCGTGDTRTSGEQAAGRNRYWRHENRRPAFLNSAGSHRAQTIRHPSRPGAGKSPGIDQVGNSRDAGRARR